MRTDRLIELLAAGEGPVAPRHPALPFAIAALIGMLIGGVVMVPALGVNPLLDKALGLGQFWFKFGYAIALTGVSGLLLARAALPGASMGRAQMLIVGLVASVLIAGAVALGAAPPEARASALLGASWTSCPALIAALSLPAFAAALIALRRFAPTRPRRAGAAAGALAGGVGMFVYAWHCPELALPFIALWYSAGAVLPTLLGAWLGPRLLRW